MSDLDQLDPQSMLARLRRMADATGRHAVDEWRDVKRQRLDALDISPMHHRLVLAQRECPKVADHAGSRDAAAAAERFVSDSSLYLLALGGPTGRGKTVAATWIAASLDACWWLSAKDVRVGDEWQQLRSRALKAANLVVDDLGQEMTEWANREIGSLIESRFDRGRRTVVTTNIPPAAVVKLYGDRFASRLNHPGLSAYVVCGGSDLRKEAK